MIKRSIFLGLFPLLMFGISTFGQKQTDSLSVVYENNVGMAIFPNAYSNNKGFVLNVNVEDSQNITGFHWELFGRGYETFDTPSRYFELYDITQTITLEQNIFGISISTFGTLSGETHFKGLSFNGLGFFVGKMKGICYSTLNTQSIEAEGLISSLIFTKVGKITGVQLGAFNDAKYLRGVQIGLNNSCEKKGKGVQVSIYNEAGEDFKGLQLGLLNKIGNWYIPIMNMRF